MSSDEEDTRIPCKYGAACYQKNSAHHTKYKHPEKRKRSKSPKINESTKKQRNEAETSEDTAKADECIEHLIVFETIEDRKHFIKQKFLVDMPDDFYLFWELCKEINKEKPKEALKNVGLTLVGPYDVLDESFQAVDKSKTHDFFLHWRYYFDPPEFQTIIKGDDKLGYHIGYFRDSPEEKPSFVGYNEANKNCTIVQMGENIFGAINTYLEQTLKTVDPFKKIPVMNLLKKVSNRAKELKINLNNYGRHRKTVCKTFHGAGIVVPYDRSTQLGYRKLPVDEKELRKILNQVSTVYLENKEKSFSSLQPVLTAATIANDECDFGTALELGINIFCFGNECFNNTVLDLLKTSYALLKRRAFAEIIEAHLSCRKKETPHVINC